MGFDAEWARCRDYLEPAVDEAWTLDAVEREVRAKRAAFWPLRRGAGVTQLHDCPRGRVLRIWLAGGDMEELKRYLPVMDAYAKAQGCIAIEVEGRPGWERVLRDYAYEKRRVVLVKELDHGSE